MIYKYFQIFAQQQMKEYTEVKHNCVRDEGTMCKGQSKFPRAAMAAV